MLSDALLALLAGRSGHFHTESGYHSERWFDLDALFADRSRLQPFVAALAERLGRHRVDAVCGPVTGGAELAARVGAELHLDAVAVEREAPPDATGFFPVRYRVPSAQRHALRGRRVAIVDDAISAGSAVRGTHADLRALGARPVALGALFVFGDAADRFAVGEGLPLESIARLSYAIWSPAECPLCRTGVALERVSDAV